jgi:hypothetical protein
MSIKYVFCINPGRSGSGYLQVLLSTAINTVSIHEGYPRMHGRSMQKFNQGDASALQSLMPIKLDEIHQVTAGGKHIYCETSHYFIKGWGYLLPDAYLPQQEIGVIILHRPIEETIYSLLRLRDVPGVSEYGRNYYLIPDAPANLTKAPPNADPYERCKWYVNEIALRSEEYKQRFPKITYFDCTLDQLNDYDFVLSLFKAFALEPSPALKAVCGKQPINTRSEWPKLSLAELLARSPYPSADALEAEDRDRLIGAMVTYLHVHGAAEIRKFDPDNPTSQNPFPAVVRIVADAEPALEATFQRGLKFTETEWILIWEFLRSINPYHGMFSYHIRMPGPGIFYRYW